MNLTPQAPQPGHVELDGGDGRGVLEADVPFHPFQKG